MVTQDSGSQKIRRLTAKGEAMPKKKGLTRQEVEREKIDLMVLRKDSVSDEHFETIVSERDEVRRLTETEGAVDVPPDAMDDLAE